MRLFKNVVIYGVSNAWGSGVSYLLILFLTKYIAPEGVGIITNFQYLAYILIPLISLSTTSSINREYYNNDIEFTEFIWQVVYIYLTTTSIVMVVMLLLGDYIAELTALPLKLVWFSIAYAMFFQAVESRMAVFRLKDKPLFFAGWKFGRGLIEIAITVGCVLWVSQDWIWRIDAFLIGNGFLFLLVIIRILKTRYYSYNKSIIKGIINYSLPLVPNAVLGAAIGFTDKLFITNYLGIEANGIYSVAFQLGMIISLLQNSFNQAWAPWLYKELSKDEISYRPILKYSVYFALGFFVVCLGIVFVAPHFLEYLNKEYAVPFQVVAFVMGGFFFHGLYKLFVNYLYYYRQTNLILFITISVAVMNIVLNWIFVPVLGMEGAALATLGAFLTQLTVTAFIVQRKYKLPWKSLIKV
ncbi:MAG: hypothetical protein CL843_12475 [Crocinitomicaceae bacterium]|nr:hypothetical protein [Crocinitomicaceae bacterium]